MKKSDPNAAERAQRAVALGLVAMLDPESEREPRQMAHAIRQLPQQPLPSGKGIDDMLGGLDCVADLVKQRLEDKVISASPLDVWCKEPKNSNFNLKPPLNQPSRIFNNY